MSAGDIWLCALPVVAYLVGGIPFGLLVGKLRGVDVRKHGSGNIGATNVGRVLGRRWGVLVFVLDVAKGCVPTAVTARLSASYFSEVASGQMLQTLLVLAVGAACIAGHIWSVYLRFRGGKGVATSLGVLLGYWPYFTLPGLLALAVWIVMVLISRYVSVASISAACSFPIFLVGVGFVMGWPAARVALLTGFSTVMAILVIWRHRSNISRLLAGTEPKIGSARRDDA